MKKLLDRQKVNEGKITALATQMVSIVQTTLKKIERIQKDIVESNKRCERLAQLVIHMQMIIDKFIWKVSNMADAIRFFGIHTGKNVSQYGKKLVKISTIIGRFRPLNGWFKYSIFRFAFTYYNSTRQTGRIVRPCENEIDRKFEGI